MRNITDKIIHIRKLRDELSKLEEEVLTEIALQNGDNPVLPLAIKHCHDLVSKHFNLPTTAMRSPVRTAPYVKARQVAMALLHKHTRYTVEEIAKSFNRVHGTVLWADRTIEDTKVSDPELYAQYQALSRSFTIYLQHEPPHAS